MAHRDDKSRRPSLFQPPLLDKFRFQKTSQRQRVESHSLLREVTRIRYSQIRNITLCSTMRSNMTPRPPAQWRRQIRGDFMGWFNVYGSFRQIIQDLIAPSLEAIQGKLEAINAKVDALNVNFDAN